MFPVCSVRDAGRFVIVPTPSPPFFWICSFHGTYVSIPVYLHILQELRADLWRFALGFAEAAEEGDVVAEHGVVGSGVLHGGVEFVLYAGDGLEEELGEVAEGVGGLVGDALFGQGGEDFAEDVVYVRDGIELAGKRSELGGQFLGLKLLLLFARVMDAERGMAFFAEHAAGAAVGGLVETLVAVGIGGVWVHGNLEREEGFHHREHRAHRGNQEQYF